jgi:hypothetical protein
MDETGITVVQHKASQVISLKGKRQVARLSSAETGALVTVVTCMGPQDTLCHRYWYFPEKYETGVA